MRAVSTEACREEVQDPGGGCYLQKPFTNPNEVLESVNDVVKKLQKWERVLRGGAKD